jgi:hypothetical protein
MSISFLFQGQIISKGRSFSDHGITNIVYNSVESLISVSNSLRNYGYYTFLSIWKSELPLLSFDEKNQLKLSFDEIIYLDNPHSSLLYIDHINSSSGMLGNKAHQLFGMNQSLLYLFENKIVGPEDIIFRSRTDINYDTTIIHNFINTNLAKIQNGAFVLQYLKKTDLIWCPDFILGGKVHLISKLYNSMFNKFACNQDYAVSIHQDIALTLCSIFTSPTLVVMFLPRTFSFKKRFKHITASSQFTNNAILFPRIKSFVSVAILAILTFIELFCFKIMSFIQSLICLSIFRMNIILLSHQFHNSIFWRGIRSKSNLSKFYFSS